VIFDPHLIGAAEAGAATINQMATDTSGAGSTDDFVDRPMETGENRGPQSISQLLGEAKLGPEKRWCLGFVAFLLVLVGPLASASRAGDRIYWANNGTNDAISYANLDGSGGHDLNTTGATLSDPEGVTIDPAAGRIYWANGGTDSISYANLDGSGGGHDLSTSGATLINPAGVAIDPVAGRIYWANASSTAPISYAALDGSGGGDLNAGTSSGTATGVAVDLPSGRVYWGNWTSDSIAYANLDDSGGADLFFSSGETTVTDPYGVAVGPAESGGGRWVYWPDASPDEIDVTPIGGGFGDHLIANPNFPHGLAIDPTTQRVYWAPTAGTTLRFFHLYASGSDAPGVLQTTGATMSGANFPALLRAPTGSGAPSISGAAVTGSVLSCSSGTWGPDLNGSFFFQTPQSFAYQWIRDGADIPGATATSITADAPGDYRCRVTAANAAGSVSQTSDPQTVQAVPSGGSTPSNQFVVGKPKLNKKNGTATLPVTVPGPGSLTLTGKGLANQPAARAPASRAVTTAGTVYLLVRPNRKTKNMLADTGRAKVKVTITFTPSGGSPNGQTKTIRLKKRLR
jgi:hypothetical protein